MPSTQKILVIRFSSIGDIVLATSPLTTLRNVFPSARIDFLTLEPFKDLLLNHPHIDRLKVLDKKANSKEIKEFGNQLRTDKYDLVVDLHNSVRSKLLRRRLPAVEKVVLKKPRWNRFKLFAFHLNHFPAGFSQRCLYHEPLNDLIPDGHPLPPSHLDITNEEKNWAESYLEEQGVSGPVFALIPGAAWPQKIWHPHRYAEAAADLKNTLGTTPVMLGSTSDEVCSEIAELEPGVVDLHGRLTLRQSLSVLACSDFAVGSDTGFIHAAEALGVPVTMIMGPTSVETGAGTLLEKSNSVSIDHLWCRPCSQNGKRPCYRKEQFCLTAISAESVVDQALKLGSDA